MINKQSLLCTKYIRSIICDNIPALQSRVYAIDARQGTKLPFAVLVRDNVSATTLSKDGCVEDTVAVSVYVVSKGYDEGVKIANDIRNLLDRSRYATNEVRIPLIEFSGAREVFTDTPTQAFIQIIQFNVKIQ